MSKHILTLTQQTLCKELGNPYFTTLSHNIQILNSPVDFYLALCVRTKQKGIRISYKRIILTSLYLGDGPLERFLADQLFNKLEVNKNLRVSMLMDFNRGHRAKDFTAYSLLKPLKANFMPNHNVKIGFFKNFHRFSANAFSGFQEIRGVQHMKIAVFDDHVLLTGANLSDSYFTDREDRWILLKDNKDLADYCDDLANSMIDISYQMDDEGRLVVIYKQYPRNLPKKSGKMKETAIERVKLFKFMQEDQPEIIPPDPIINPEKPGKENENSLSLYKIAMDQTEKLKRTLRSEDVFNVLKDMPHDLNIITGEGGWKNEVIKTGSTVYLFPCLQLHNYGCDDDYYFMKKILSSFTELYMASGYMAFPKDFLDELTKIKKLSLISASPYVNFIQANGFLNDGIKNWIPYFYRVYLENARKSVNNAEFFEYFKEGWTFHAKGMWASDGNGVYFTSIGSSNFSRRSYFRDTEFQLYMWSDCSNFREQFWQEKNRVWRSGFNDPNKFPLKYGMFTKFMGNLLRSYL